METKQNQELFFIYYGLFVLILVVFPIKDKYKNSVRTRLWKTR